MKVTRTTSYIAATVIIALSISVYVHNRESKKKNFFICDVVDLGRVPARSWCSASFSWKNSRPVPVKIVHTAVSCGCTVTGNPSGKLLMPGAEEQLNVKFYPTTIKASTAFLVEFSDGTTERLKIQSTPFADYVLVPEELRFQQPSNPKSSLVGYVAVLPSTPAQAACSKVEFLKPSVPWLRGETVGDSTTPDLGTHSTKMMIVVDTIAAGPRKYFCESATIRVTDQFGIRDIPIVCSGQINE